MAFNEIIDVDGVKIRLKLDYDEQTALRARLLQAGLQAIRGIVAPEFLMSTELAKRVRKDIYGHLEGEEGDLQTRAYIAPLYNTHYLSLMFDMMAILALDSNFIGNRTTGEVRINGLDIHVDEDYWLMPDMTLYDAGYMPRPPIRNRHHPYEKMSAYVTALFKKYPFVLNRLRRLLSSVDAIDNMVSVIEQAKQKIENGDQDAIATERTFPQDGERLLDGNAHAVAQSNHKKVRRKRTKTTG